jgi:uncharacterized protein YjiK
MGKAMFRLVIAALLAACGAPSSVEARDATESLFQNSPAQQQRLSDQLREISGLAVAPDGRLFAHDDEHAVIYQLDAARGGIVKSFSLGNEALTGDFEGLAIGPDGAFWMTTSQGRLYRFAEGANGASVPFETFDSALNEICEVEGLAYAPSEESLILACKQNHARRMRDEVSLYRWQFSGAAQPWRDLPEAEIAGAAGVEHFRPSSIEFDATSGRILLLSARDSALAELGPDGALLSARALGRGHAQPEGAAVLPDGSLVISDEASGGRPVLTRYARTP